MYFSIFNEKKISEISVDKLLKEVNEYSKDEIEKMKLLSFILGLFIKNNLEKVLKLNLKLFKPEILLNILNYNGTRSTSTIANSSCTIFCLILF